MNFQILHDSVDISDHTIDYNRNQQICTGIGTIDINLENKNLGRTIYPWDKVVLYEDGNKIGTYIVATVKNSADGGTISLQCQDYSKKVIDNYIVETYDLPYVTTTRYWIEFFLSNSDVDYQFTVADDDTGEIVAPGAGFGTSSAYDLILSFLQQSGWYIYFNKNGKAIIGTLEKAGDNYKKSITDSSILSLERTRDDKRLRNRAVVWGAGDPTTGTWIKADITKITPWNYDSDDERAIVFANSSIYSTLAAEDLAQKMIKEFSRIANEVIVEIIGHYDIELGDMVFVKSKHFSGRMRVTTIESTGSENGLIVKLTLNQMCPRLFAYFGTLGDFVPVYIGTWGQGIWRKYTGSTIWTDVSTGLEGNALCIKDMFIKQGILACTTLDGYMYYGDITLNYWSKFLHGILLDQDGIEYLEEDVRAEAVTIDDAGNIIVGYNYISEDQLVQRAWIVTVSPLGTLIKTEQIIATESDEIQLIDLEAVGLPEEGIIESVKMKSGYGLVLTINKHTAQSLSLVAPSSPAVDEYFAVPDKDTFTAGPISDYEITQYLQGGTSLRYSQLITDNTNHGYYLGTTSGDTVGNFVDFNFTSWTKTNYTFTPPTYWFDHPTLKRFAVLRKRTTNTFDIGWIDYDSVYNGEITFKNYLYTLGGGTPTETYTRTLKSDSGYPPVNIQLVGVIARDNIVAIAFSFTEGTKQICRLFVYNFVGNYGQEHTITVDYAEKWEEHMYYAGITDGGSQPTLLATGNEIILAKYFMTLEDMVYLGPIFPGGENWQPRKLYVRVKAILVDGNGIETIYDNDPAPLIRLQEAPAGKYINSGVYDPYWHKRRWAGANYGYSSAFDILEYKWNTSDGWGGDYEVNLTSLSVEWPYITPFDLRLSAVNEVLKQTSTDSWYDPYGIFHWDVKPPGYTDFLYSSWFEVDDGANSARFTNPLYLNNKEEDYNFDTQYRTGLQYVNAVDLRTLDVEAHRLRQGLTYEYNENTSSLGFRDDADNSIYKSGSFGVGTGIIGANSTLLPLKIITESTPLSFGINAMMLQYFLAYTTSSVDIFKVAPADETINSTILKHTTLMSEETGEEESSFEIIHEAPQILKVEISKGTPTVVYSTPLASGWYLPDDEFLPYMAASINNLPTDFYFLPEGTDIAGNPYEYRDVKTMDIPDSFPISDPEKSLPPSLLERYVTFTTSGEVIMMKYDFTGDFYQLVTLSGLMVLTSGMIPPPDPLSILNLIETTNYTIEPYLFITTSGTPSSLFFQRINISGYSPGWQNHSFGLPLSGITVVRVDDDI